MGTYCTVRDVRNALTPGGDPTSTETAAGLPDWQIEDAILEAEGTINAYIATRYAITPIEVEEENPENPGEILVYVVAPAPLRSWTRDIAAYLSALTFRRHKDLPEDDPIRLRYGMVREFLTAIRDRTMDLTLPTNDSDDQGVHIENPYTGDLFSLSDFGLGYDSRYPMAQHYWPARRV